jgi:hypothetical protein
VTNLRRPGSPSQRPTQPSFPTLSKLRCQRDGGRSRSTALGIVSPLVLLVAVATVSVVLVNVLVVNF